MKATGIVRRIDELGRIVIPIELRSILGIGDKAPLEIYTTEDGIYLKPYQPDAINKLDRIISVFTSDPMLSQQTDVLKKLHEAKDLYQIKE